MIKDQLSSSKKFVIICWSVKECRKAVSWLSAKMLKKEKLENKSFGQFLKI